MKSLIGNKFFVFGFMCGLLMFGLLTKFTADFQITEDGTYRQLYGFPFLQYERYKGFISTRQIYWSGMFGNLLIALIGSFCIGIFFRFVGKNYLQISK